MYSCGHFLPRVVIVALVKQTLDRTWGGRQDGVRSAEDTSHLLAMNTDDCVAVA